MTTMPDTAPTHPAASGEVHSRTTTFRRRAGGVAVLLAPIAFITAELAYPIGDEQDPATSLGVFAEHHVALLTSIYAMMLASVLFIPAFFALMTPARGRGTVLTHLGAGMALLGAALSKLALLGIQFVFYEASAPGVDRAAVGHFLGQATTDPAGVPFVSGHYLFAIGILLLAVGLYRARVGYRWAAIALALAPVLEIVLSSVGLPESHVLTAVVYAPLVVGGAGMAHWLLTTSNAAWEGFPIAARATSGPVEAAA
jgi:Domain of unknown function (DUF4386)